MKAAFFHGKGQPLKVRDTPKPHPTEKQVLVRLHFAALNHRDLWIRREQDKHLDDGIILGSDGSGVIESVGEEIDPELEGQEVVINPSHKWGKNPVVQGDSFQILGFPDHGTFSQYIAISRDHIFEKPEHLSLQSAAALPLSGLTAYRALFTKARVRPGEKVLITGAGGGTALYALQFAKAFKARVFVTSGSDEKISKAIALGAENGYNYREPGWVERANREASGFDAIIDGAAGEGFDRLTDLAAPGGRIVLYGRTTGTIREINPRTLYWKQISLHGSTMGTRDEFLSMLDFTEKHKIEPVIAETFPMDDIEAALAKLEAGTQFGKIVLTLD